MERVPTRFVDLLTPVLVVFFSMGLVRYLEELDVIPSVYRELAWAIVGAIVCWLVASLMTPRQPGERSGRG